MKIAIVVYSKTGSCLSLAELIRQALHPKGHEVTLFELKVEGDPTVGKQPGKATYKILNQPDVSAFDVVIAGGPVWAFRACCVIKEAISALDNLSGKHFIPFTTMSFPFRGMGGTATLNTLAKIARNKGAKVHKGAIARKMLRNYPEELGNAVHH
ncbi:MAG: hypothetical protein PHI68_03035, partial [Candidatus Cloacimonetes bacterium]|nr:hypothetical protein [Candidatus Cloacimonadota bacterium]